MVRIDDTGLVIKCWFLQEELDDLERVARDVDWEQEVAMQLMGRCGLRADEVPYPADSKIRWSDQGECWLLEVRGKNTKGGSTALRDAWVPDRVAESIHRYARERGLGEDDSWVDVSKNSVRRWVKEAVEQLHRETGDQRWRHVSSYDLRRNWATYHLVERGVDIRTMMAVGGWSSYSAIEPYLDEPTEGRIGAVMKAD